MSGSLILVFIEFDKTSHAHTTRIKFKIIPWIDVFHACATRLRVVQDRISNPLNSINSLRTCSSDHAALFADLDWLPFCVSVRGFTVCLLICSAIPSIQTLLLSFMTVCWLGWVLFFFSPFPGTFSVILGPDGEGHGSTSFVRASL